MPSRSRVVTPQNVMEDEESSSESSSSSNSAPLPTTSGLGKRGLRRRIVSDDDEEEEEKDVGVGDEDLDDIDQGSPDATTSEESSSEDEKPIRYFIFAFNLFILIF